MIETWIKVRELILPALTRPPQTHTEDDVLVAIYSGNAVLWASDNHRGAIVTEFVNSPRHKTLHYWLVGGEMDAVLSLEPRIEKFARQNGCDMTSASGRKGWTRVLKHWKEASTLMYRELI